MMEMILLTVIIGVDFFVYVVIQLYFEGNSHFVDKVQGLTKMKKRTEAEIMNAALIASLTSRRPAVIFKPLTESERMQEELEPIYHPHPTQHDESDDIEMVK